MQMKEKQKPKFKPLNLRAEALWIAAPLRIVWIKIVCMCVSDYWSGREWGFAYLEEVVLGIH